MRPPSLIVPIAAAMGAPAFAQTLDAGWLIALDYGPGRTAVAPGNPSVRVTLSAYFPRQMHAFAAARWDVEAAEPGWSDNLVIPPLTVGANPGTIAGGAVRGIIAGQFFFPPTIPADPSNPIRAWTAVWTTTEFQRRRVDILTDTARFDLYQSGGIQVPIVIPAFFREGSAQIRVVPAPVSLLLLLGIVVPRRRGAR